MRAALAALATLASLSAPFSISATVPPPPPPHHPERAACAIEALLGAIDRGDPAALAGDVKIYSNRLGEVTPNEFDRFVEELAGREDRSIPLRLHDWGVLHVDGVSPLYVISVNRGAADNHWSAWLVGFVSDRISILRRADELWPFATGRHFFAARNCAEAGQDG